MKEILINEEFDTRLYPSDWRYSAAIVGLMKFFDNRDINYKITDDYIMYNQADIYGEEAWNNYLLFVETYFADAMHHRVIENILANEEISEEQEKLVNEKLKGNTICSKIFGKIKYSKENRMQILNTIEENRLELIRETFRSGKATYSKYANTNKLFTEKDRVSRLNGYYVDLPKKGKSIAYKWDYNTYIANDEPEFDFIVFAFSKTWEGFFINNNVNIQDLYNANAQLQEAITNGKENDSRNPRSYIFRTIQESSAFIEYDVEIICKSQDKDIYETMFIRRKAIEIFKKIGKSGVYSRSLAYRPNDGKDKSCEDIVTESILNNVRIDNLIEKLLREKNIKYRLISNLITINQEIYGGKEMQKNTYFAKEAASKVRSSLIRKKAENKLNSYRQKLISAICFKDYDRYCDILLSLSSYSEVPLDFAYDLFDDFENNKNIAYAFALGLHKEDNNTDKKVDNSVEAKEDK